MESKTVSLGAMRLDFTMHWQCLVPNVAKSMTRAERADVYGRKCLIDSFPKASATSVRDDSIQGFCVSMGPWRMGMLIRLPLVILENIRGICLPDWFVGGGGPQCPEGYEEQARDIMPLSIGQARS